MHAGKIKYLTLTDPSKVWMPDLFFSNEREGHFHNIIVPNVYVRIFPNGKVLYSIRYIRFKLKFLNLIKINFFIEKKKGFHWLCRVRWIWNCTHSTVRCAPSLWSHVNLFQFLFVIQIWIGNLYLSDGWTTDDLIFKWRQGDPVQVAKNMHLPRFILEKFEAEYCDSTTNTGNNDFSSENG